MSSQRSVSATFALPANDDSYLSFSFYSSNPSELYKTAEMKAVEDEIKQAFDLGEPKTVEELIEKVNELLTDKFSDNPVTLHKPGLRNQGART